MHKVLITGIAGYIGSHCALQLLRAGFAVRGTLRDVKRGPQVTAMLARHVEAADRIEICQADLATSEHWEAAVAGCNAVVHVASPIPSVQPRDPEELIRPAREGTLHLLRAAHATGVKRVVMTSSIGAICYGHGREPRVFTEKDWTNLDAPDLIPYIRSKTIAERAAWDYTAQTGGALELVVINPGHCLGPVLGDDVSPSVAFILRMLEDGNHPWPPLGFNLVDVRDVAAAHVAALQVPQAAGERIALVTEHFWLADIAKVLKAHYGKRFPIDITELSDVDIRERAKTDPQLHDLLPYLGQRQDVSNARLKSLLNIEPITPQQSIIDSAESFIRAGHVRF